MRIWERMKTKLGAIMIAALLLTMAAGEALAVSYPFTGVVTDDTNMRLTANSYTANIIRRIPEGDAVTVTGATGNFYRIEYDGKTGYVFKQYVKESKTPTGSGAGLTATGYPYQTVATTSVNLRKSASTSAKKLDTIPRGARITVHGLSGAWANVTYDGTTGWVMKEYIQVATIVKPTATPNPIPTISFPATDPSVDSGYQLLRSGSQGDHVIALQEALIELGFLTGRADGIFGSGTAQAVMALQRKNGYPVTGTADQNLQAMIFSGTPLNINGKKTVVNTLPAINGLTVRAGNKGVMVRTIQSMLLDKGYSVSVTGIYDEKTVAAMKAFQRKNGLTDDGICGPATQKLLFGSGLSSSATATPKPTPTPTALPELEKPRSTVRYGSRGSDAKLVQQRLIDLKYLTGKADGMFGSQSVAALKAFQRNNRLVDDGVAGSGTNALLFSYLALAADEKPTVLPTPTPPPTSQEITKDNVVVIRQGVTGNAVLRLQQRLQQLGYYTSSLDSKCEIDDVVAIRLFQRKNGLSEDGVAGYDTQVLLYSDRAVMYNGNLAGSLTMSYEPLKKGMTGEAVRQLQSRLIELNYLSGKPDGIYGTSTAEAIYYFQKTNGLVRDSIAGESTLTRLFSTSAIPNKVSSATSAPTTPPATITTALLRLGDENESVKAMQQTLINLGYLTGRADGKFGTLTYRALKEFQKDNALFADGVAGSQTIAALNSANKAPTVTDSPSSGGQSQGNAIAIMARNVKYEYWYSTVRNEARKYPYATLFDPESGISWQVHMFSFGKHAEIEPLTRNDTAKMNQVCGAKKSTPKPVWVIFADGTIRIATTHSRPHGVQHRTNNDFPGHCCLHFPRTMAQVTSIGPYATKHQNTVDKAWAELQASLNK